MFPKALSLCGNPLFSSIHIIYYIIFPTALHCILLHTFLSSCPNIRETLLSTYPWILKAHRSYIENVLGLFYTPLHHILYHILTVPFSALYCPFDHFHKVPWLLQSLIWTCSILSGLKSINIRDHKITN